MDAPPSLSELEHLRLAICQNTQDIPDLAFLRAIALLQQAWFAQAAHLAAPRDPSAAPVSPPLRFLGMWALVVSALSG